LVNIQNNFKRKSDIRKFTDTAFKFIFYGPAVLQNTVGSDCLSVCLKLLFKEQWANGEGRVGDMEMGDTQKWTT
jgi:hypothetical protein